MFNWNRSSNGSATMPIYLRQIFARKSMLIHCCELKLVDYATVVNRWRQRDYGQDGCCEILASEMACAGNIASSILLEVPFHDVISVRRVTLDRAIVKREEHSAGFNHRSCCYWLPRCSESDWHHIYGGAEKCVFVFEMFAHVLIS